MLCGYWHPNTLSGNNDAAISRLAIPNSVASPPDQGCLKVNSGSVFGELNASQREHSFDVVGQRAQTAAN